MASANDVKKFLEARLAAAGTPCNSHRKVQKLLYYCQGWSLAWTGRPLFDDRIEAWVEGPVVRDVWTDWRHHDDASGNQRLVSDDEAAIIDAVLQAYGSLSASDLINLTHNESPWLDARGDIPADMRSATEISKDAMAGFFSQMNDASSEVPEPVVRGLKMLSRMSEQDVADFVDVSTEPLDWHQGRLWSPLVAFGGLWLFCRRYKKSLWQRSRT